MSRFGRSISNDQWYELTDPTTNYLFYANANTGECRWTRPNSSKILQNALPEWWELYDENTKAAYYYNNTEQETYWELPQNLLVHPIPLSSADDRQLRNILGNPPPNATRASIDQGESAEAAPESSRESESEYSEPEADLPPLPPPLMTLPPPPQFSNLPPLPPPILPDLPLPPPDLPPNLPSHLPPLPSPPPTPARNKTTNSPLSKSASSLTRSLTSAHLPASPQLQRQVSSAVDIPSNFPPPLSARTGSPGFASPNSTPPMPPKRTGVQRQISDGSSPTNYSMPSNSLYTSNPGSTPPLSATYLPPLPPPNVRPIPVRGDQANPCRQIDLKPRANTDANSTQPTARGVTPQTPTSNITNDLRRDINLFQLEGYAKKYFQTAKKGVFRRAIPLQELLKWSKAPLTTSLLKMNKASVTKEAINLFKMVQSYMGEKPSKRDINQIAQQIVEKAINVPELRDELYCQLCKQTTLNPEIESTYKGWDLLCIACSYFPPTKDLEQWLLSYIKEQLKLEDLKLRAYAAYCLRRLPKLSSLGARGRVPTVKEIERTKIAPFEVSIFGNRLEEIVEHQNKKLQGQPPVPVLYTQIYHQTPALPLPYVLTVLSDAVAACNGHATEGIFRVPGDGDAITNLRLQIESGDYTVRTRDPHVPAGLLKLWLRELDEPIIPEHLYDPCIEAAKREEVPAMLELIAQLPELHQRVVHYMVKYLQLVAAPENSDKTKMTVNNLAMVFAPNFLRCPSDNPGVIFESTKYEQIYVRALIMNLK